MQEWVAECVLDTRLAVEVLEQIQIRLVQGISIHSEKLVQVKDFAQQRGAQKAWRRVVAELERFMHVQRVNVDQLQPREVEQEFVRMLGLLLLILLLGDQIA